MKLFKTTLAALLFTLLPVAASAQLSKLSQIPQRNEIVTIESEDEIADTDFGSAAFGGVEIREVFDMPDADGNHHYYLSVGHLGFGDDFIQMMIDPVFELFIPLGDTLEEAQQVLEDLKALFKQPKGSSIEVQGCLAFGVPNDKLETVRVTYCKPLVSKLLEFSIQREGYTRASHVLKADIGTLLSGVKFYRKIHPKEK